MKNKHFSSIAILIIVFILSVTPLIIQGSLYFVGGDDTRLYYIYPRQYIQNLLLNIVSDNTIGGANTGYYPATHPIPLVTLIWILKTLFPVNTQFLMYGLNLALGFLFFYLFLGLWIDNETKTKFFIKVIASLFYIFSPFLINTLYKHQIIVVYLIATAPGVLYFFIKSVRDRNPLYVFTTCLIFTILSTNLSSLPWSLPILITSLPILIVIFSQSKKTFIFHSILFMISYLLLNLSWIFHLINSSLNNTGIANNLSNLSSPSFIETNIKGILGTSRLFSPLNQVVNQLDSNLVKNFSLLSFLNLIFLVLIVLAGVILPKEKNKTLTIGYIVSLLGLLVSWFLIASNFGIWGPNAFIFLSLKIPFFTMFRNMFDKFSLTLGFYYAFGLAVSLVILLNKVPYKKMFTLLLVGISVLIFINALPLFALRESHEGVRAKVSGTFNDDFNKLVAYLSNLKNPSRVLWLPLNYPTYVSVEDKYNSGHFYSGPSPLRFLANRQDYTGQFSFITASDINIGDKIFPMIKEKKYSDFGKLAQLLNARYVILDKQNLPDSMKPFLYSHYSEKSGKLKMQTSEFINSLLGKKLQDFGFRYSLYEINPQFNNDRIYLTDDFNIFPKSLPNVEYSKNSSASYTILLKNLSTEQKLVFLDPYYKDWTLYLVGENTSLPYQKGENIVVQNFANGWVVDPSYIKKNFPTGFYKTNDNGSLDVSMSLYFEPE